MKAPLTNRYSTAVWYPTSQPVWKNSPGSPSAGGGSSRVSVLGFSNLTESVRSRQPPALISGSPASSVRVASNISTRLPGRTIRASTRSGVIGTERRTS
jgi:hypothetical protein